MATEQQPMINVERYDERTHYDYERQAWVVDGCYVDCGHLLAQPCRCYGRLHKGEPEITLER